MNKYVTHVALAALLLFLGLKDSNAQSKIMDAKFDIASGQMSVYLTDTSGLASIQIDIGSQIDGSDLYTGNYASTGSFISQGGTIANNVLTINVGSLHVTEAFSRISLVLSNAETREISIQSSH